MNQLDISEFIRYEVYLSSMTMLVVGDNPIWNDTEEDTSFRVCQVEGLEEQEKELRKRLQIAGSCTAEDHKQLEELL